MPIRFLVEGKFMRYLFGIVGILLMSWSFYAVGNGIESPFVKDQGGCCSVDLTSEIEREKRNIKVLRARNRELLDGIQAHLKLLDQLKTEVETYFYFDSSGLRRLSNSKHLEIEENLD